MPTLPLVAVPLFLAQCWPCHRAEAIAAPPAHRIEVAHPMVVKPRVAKENTTRTAKKASPAAEKAKPAEPAPPAVPADQVRAEIRMYYQNAPRTGITTDLVAQQAAQNADPQAREYYLSNGKEFASIKCLPQQYSAPTSYLGPQKLQLFRKAEDSDNSQTPYVPVAETQLPSNGGKFILFLDGNPKSPRIVAFPRDAATLPKGRMFLFNSTSAVLGVDVGKDHATLDPGASHIFDVSGFTDYQMPLGVREQTPSEWKSRIQIRSSIYFDKQNLAVLTQDTQSNSISFSFLPQVFETETSAPAGPR